AGCERPDEHDRNPRESVRCAAGRHVAAGPSLLSFYSLDLYILQPFFFICGFFSGFGFGEEGEGEGLDVRCVSRSPLCCIPQHRKRYICACVQIAYGLASGISSSLRLHMSSTTVQFEGAVGRKMREGGPRVEEKEKVKVKVTVKVTAIVKRRRGWTFEGANYGVTETGLLSNLFVIDGSQCPCI
ncbi:hypothetical protein GGS21DRAFT_510975, partial [Xylaria nigripes]